MPQEPDHASSDRPSYEFVARGLTTRPVQIEGETHLTAISREALEDMARQIRESHVGMAPEHLSYLGPIGRWVDAEVVDQDDGHSELLIYGAPIDAYSPRHSDPPVLEQLENLPEGVVPTDLEVSCGVELRIFPEDQRSEIQDSAPIPLKQQSRWADLPPLEWVFTIPVVWGAMKFAGAFFSELGRVSAENLVDWLKDWAGRAKKSDRDWIVTLRFELPDGSTVSGYIPVAADDDHAARSVVNALESSGIVASLAGAQSEMSVLDAAKEVALLYDDDGWHLAWWTDGERVFKTLWFDQNKPQPDRFLGRPLFEHGPSSPSVAGSVSEEE